MTRCIPWFHLTQGRSKVRQALERVVEIFVTLYDEGMWGVNEEGRRNNGLTM